MTKKSEKPKTYIAQVELSDDKTKSHWEVGSVVKDGDFPAQVIENWLELGVLAEVQPDGDEQ